jgi:imidazole glycerol-phosphate synthase subunit HisH
MTPIAIVDYGMANLRSVQKAFERVGHEAVVTGDPDVIADSERVVLPGVGAFRDAIGCLRETGLSETILEHIEEGYPFLGICLGLQLLFTRSCEDGIHPGLDLLPGEVIRFENVPGLKVPHMGWNELTFDDACPLFHGLPQKSAVYFVHSYYPAPVDGNLVAARADYPTPFCAAVWRDHLYATQFHPEKSQAVGLQMLKNFAERC